jgi:hypothetical protein
MNSRKARRKRAQLAERDGWACCFCGQPIDPDKAFPEPMHATVHHVGREAGNSLANLRLAHDWCHREHNRTTEQEAA